MIREIEMKDPHVAEDIWYLQHAAFREEAIRIGLKSLPPLMETVEDLRSSKERYVGFLAEEEWVGALAYDLIDTRLSIRRLMVAPSQFRQGIGSALLDYVLTTVSHGQAEVYAGERNEPAIRLYCKLGFTPVEQVIVGDGLQLTRFIRHAG